ncbi:MAG: hypothetical protein P8L21_04050 [Polaribacter sp.]|nr:hypothetical protein [Polaribacter sp.]
MSVRFRLLFDLQYQTYRQMKNKNLRINMLKQWAGSEAHKNMFRIKKWTPKITKKSLTN